MFSNLYAMAGQAGNGGSEPSLIAGLLPLLLMFAIFYFILIRPQQKKAKAHQSMIGGLKKGDNVITSGGIIGTITGFRSDNILIVKVSDNTKISILKSSVSRKFEENQDSNADGKK